MLTKKYDTNIKEIRKIKAIILIDLDNPYKKGIAGKFIKTELARILKEFADIEGSAYGGQRGVETYTDKEGNKLTSIVAFDFGCEIPYAKLAFED